MKRFLLSLIMAATFAAGQTALLAADPLAPVRADPSVEQRLEDLEAYVNNAARVADNTNNVGSKLGTYMTRAASRQIPARATTPGK